MDTMFHSEAIEFPFVTELPKRERKRVMTVWERFEAIKKVTDEKGMLLPVVFAAKLLGISQQRVHNIIADGRLEAINLDGHKFIPEESFVAFCKLERKNGRPVKLKAPSFGECLEVSREVLLDGRK